MFKPMPENSQDKGALLVDYKDDGKSVGLTPEELKALPDAIRPRFERISASLTDLDAKVKATTPPEKYDLTIPKDSLLDDKRKDAISAFAKAEGLSNKAAQAMLQREHDTLKANVDSNATALDEREKAWLAEIQADKEVGGDRFKESAALVGAMFKKYGNEELNKFLESSKLGNEPHLFKMMSKLGRLTGDDKLVQGGNQPPKTKSVTETMYDNPTSPKPK